MKIIIVLLAGIAAGYVLARRKLGSGMGRRRAEEKARNKNKILDMFQSESRLTNSQAQQALDVSDATATRYFDELEKEGKITQHGSVGHDVYYTLR